MKKSNCELVASISTIEVTQKELEHLAINYSSTGKNAVAEYYKDVLNKTSITVKNYKVEKLGYYSRRKITSTCDASKCRFYDKCMAKSIFINPDSDIIIPKAEKITVDEAFQSLEKAYNDAKGMDGITVIKSECGLGKTQCYLKEQGALIAVPTHALAREVHARAMTEGNVMVLVPEIPNIKSVRHAYETGNNESARAIIKNEAKNGNQEAVKYLEAIELLEKPIPNQSTIITHSRLVHLSKSVIAKYKVCVIDEDPAFTALHSATSEIKISEIKKCVYQNPTHYSGEILVKAQLLMGMCGLEGVVHSASINNLPRFSGLEEIASVLLADYFAWCGTDRICYGRKINFKQFKKAIILSATTDPDIISAMFGQIPNVVEIKEAKHQGRMTQVNYNTSMASKKLNDDAIKIPPSFKEISCKQETPFMHVFASQGRDEYKGQDIIITHTPRPNPLGMAVAASCCGIPPCTGDMEIKVRKTAWGAKWAEYNDPCLDKIAAWTVNTLLTQAVGRGRVVRCDCDVIVVTTWDGLNVDKVVSRDITVDGWWHGVTLEE